MTEKKRAPESEGKDAESDGDQTPMERFKGVTRQLLGVSRDQLRKEQQKYEQEKKKRAAKRANKK
jgi:hypothetical protein